MKRGAWIAGPTSDLVWSVLCPVVSLLALTAVWRWSGLSDRAVYAIMFAFIVTGHHMPAWLRAFGEPTVYRRYKARLLTSFVVIPVLVLSLTLSGLGVVALSVVAVFDLWHVAMQQHGMARIYGAKAGDVGRASPWLDLACTLTWYVTVVALSDSWMAGLAAATRNLGVPVFDALGPEAWGAIQTLLVGVSLGLLAAYVAHAVVDHRRSGTSPILKHVVQAVAFGVLAYSYQDPSWHRAQSAQNLFHSLQNFFVIWVYGNLALRKAAEAPPGSDRGSEGGSYRAFYRYFFANRRGLPRYALIIGLYGLLTYILACFASGLNTGLITTADLPLLAADWTAAHGIEVLGSFGLASVLLHYYAEGFIWKVRSKPVRATFDIERPGEVEPDELTERPARGIAHATVYFGLPALLFLGIGGTVRPEAATLASLRHETGLFPRSAAVHSDYGEAALAAGDETTARAELERALALSPTIRGPASTLLRLARARGDGEAALRFAQAAVHAVPEDPDRRLALAAELRAAGRLDEATLQEGEARSRGAAFVPSPDSWRQP